VAGDGCVVYSVPKQPIHRTEEQVGRITVTVCMVSVHEGNN
jgi:hypothetical protein